MAWILLISAGVLEIIWASAMKLSHGFSRPLPTTVMAVTLIASFALLAAAMRTLPLGTDYTVWTGIGAVGAFVVGIAFMGESVSAARIVAALLILAGIVLMKLTSQ
ncbi:multidrug efflux SMR transporter [Sphingomonas sp.]|uniref:DMT family transporter n=1 Tax=Sphingomonas sp. TaxID=28214 RepID=UPI002CE073B0|nr:multidrug efflux SMR transporter [Sphingomonas sp.]HWK35866.1 multidrug efflux SMR transporter [Sphingomonas sp.]